ncbi:MAG: hypothetical protein ACE5GO_03915 [Anaerolineales bacterium]
MSTPNHPMPPNPPPIFQSVPADEFTDREETIDFLVWQGSTVANDTTPSRGILGRRRMGKTAVLHTVYNRLFWEQDDVVPIYFTFESQPTGSTAFAWNYFVNFLQQYVAFRRKDDDLARRELSDVQIDNLVTIAESMTEDPIAHYARHIMDLIRDPDTWLDPKLRAAVCLPRRVMEYNRARGKPETPIFMMLDEFQDVLKINYSDGTPADTVGLYQWASEGRKCPHIVTGSALRLITQKTLGTGALFGRFSTYHFPPMPNIHGLELVEKLARKYQVAVPEPVAGYLVSRCGGNPFYIWCVLVQAVEQRLPHIRSEREMDALLAHEVSQGHIWQDWHGQLERYFQEVNSHKITRTVLFYAAEYEDELIEPEEIAQRVKRSPDEVYQILRQLAYADMVEAHWGLFRNVKDPILRDFIRSQYLIGVRGQSQTQVGEELLDEYQTLQRKYANLLGALVEARLEALLHRFDNRTVSGDLFHTVGEVHLPKFKYVSDTVVKPPNSRAYQIDLQGRWHEEYDRWAWVVEIKHWQDKVTPGVVRKFVAACEALKKEQKVVGMVKWMVNKGGFTAGALELLDEHDIYYSGQEEINTLLHALGIERVLRA